MNHCGTKILETERLILRPFRIEDANQMYQNWAGSHNVTKYLTWPAHSSPDISKMVLNSWIKEYDDIHTYQWCVEYKENHEAIGSMSVVRLNEEVGEAEIGYCIGERYWNRGITSEAFQRTIRFLFDEVKCGRVSAKHDVNNPNSGKVMLKCGLTYEGTLRRAGKNNTGICDMAVYAIINPIAG